MRSNCLQVALKEVSESLTGFSGRSQFLRTPCMCTIAPQLCQYWRQKCHLQTLGRLHRHLGSCVIRLASEYAPVVGWKQAEPSEIKQVEEALSSKRWLGGSNGNSLCFPNVPYLPVAGVSTFG